MDEDNEIEKTNKYKKLSKKEIEGIIEKHQEWIDSGGKQGEKANFKYAIMKDIKFKKLDLNKVNFRYAIMHRARLRHTNFDGANFRNAIFIKSDLGSSVFNYANLENTYLKNARLHRAKFYSASLVKTNINGADLDRASFEKADLNEAKGLSNVTLKYTDLTETKGFLGTEFSAKDITGCKLPIDFNLNALQNIKEISQNARKIFFAMLLGCVYSWLTIATTTDVKLLTNTASSPLPIIGTEIPIAWFYIAAPIVLICLYLYLHFYLQGLWESLASLPAIFPDGKRLDERAYPWLLNRLVRKHFNLLKNRPTLAHLQEYVIIFLAWWVVPITMIAFWLRYLVRHDFSGTIFHGILTITIFFLSLYFYNCCEYLLQKKDIINVENGGLYRIKYISIILIAICIFVPVSMYGFNGLGANFREKDISIKPNDYYKIDSVEIQMESIKGANLKGKNLNYADMSQAFLVKADLRSSNLKEANLENANLQQADLENANLRKADLENANLRKADLENANLQQADLENANLQKADLKNVNLEYAYLENANLEDADLGNAYLDYASLKNANLQKAYLKKTKYLTISKLSQVKTLYEAKLDPEIFEQVKECCSHLLEKPKED